MTVSLDAFAAIVGPAHVLTGDAAAPCLTDWTGAYRGEAEAVVRPASTGEVAGVIRAARAQGLAVTVQSGNTSVSGGSVPVRPGGIVLSMARLTRIRDIDAAARTVTVDAGVVVQTLQDAVAAHSLDFPLTFGARGSAMIGGTLATNAGGANVLRYGNARDLCLGIEAVTPDGEILHGLTGLRKDNTGYDLKDLLIGSEGTLGVITGAVLKLVPAPRVRATAFLALRDLRAALDVLNALQDATGGLVEAFEWMPGDMVAAICAHNPAIRAPLETRAEHGVLVELASTRAGDAAEGEDGAPRLQSGMLEIVAGLMEGGLIVDGAFAASEQQRRDLWTMRESALETIVALGRCASLDVALPLSRVPDFLDRAAPLADAEGLRRLLIAHLGDGNVHYAVVAGERGAPDPAAVARFTEAMLDLVVETGGSYSAEHGIGRAKTRVLAARKDPAQLAVMRRIKRALDPDGVLNPGILWADD